MLWLGKSLGIDQTLQNHDRYYMFLILLMEEIPHHPANKRINYLPQLVSRISSIFVHLWDLTTLPSFFVECFLLMVQKSQTTTWHLRNPGKGMEYVFNHININPWSRRIFFANQPVVPNGVYFLTRTSSRRKFAKLVKQMQQEKEASDRVRHSLDTWMPR